MKPRLRLLLCAFLLAGCLQSGGKVSAPTSPQAVVFERLAVAVESGEFSDSTQRAVKVIGKTLKAHGIKPPEGYDAALSPWLTNKKPTDAECREMAEKLRSLK